MVAAKNNIAREINESLEQLWLKLEAKEKRSTDFQLNSQQLTLLTLVIRNPKSTPSELADQLNITKSAISQQLVKLEKAGYIIRKQQKEDKRIFTVELAAAGIKYKEEVAQYYSRISALYEETLSQAELESFKNILHKLSHAVEKL